MAQVRVRNSSQFRVAVSAARAVAQAYMFPPTAGALATAASTAGFTPPKGVNAFRLYYEVTSVTATPSVVFSIQVRDNLADQWHTILSSAAVATVSRGFLEVGPNVAAVANVAAGKYIGSKIRVIATHADTDSITYSLTGEWTA